MTFLFWTEGPGVTDRWAEWRWCLVIGNDGGGGKEMVRSSNGIVIPIAGKVYDLYQAAIHNRCHCLRHCLRIEGRIHCRVAVKPSRVHICVSVWPMVVWLSLCLLCVSCVANHYVSVQRRLACFEWLGLASLKETLQEWLFSQFNMSQAWSALKFVISTCIRTHVVFCCSSSSSTILRCLWPDTVDLTDLLFSWHSY